MYPVIEDFANTSSSTVNSEENDDRTSKNKTASKIIHLTKPTFAKSRIQEELILGIIKQADALQSETIDLSKKGLLKIPDDLLQLEHLEYLYLAENEIQKLPEDFFSHLHRLKWLDLRSNCLVSLPSAYTGRHKHLRNLLLENNLLHTLPLELGLIKTLHGLNIRNNPLDFPPYGVIAQGTHAILNFLCQMLIAKSEQKSLSEINEAVKSPDLQIRSVTETSSKESTHNNLYLHTALSDNRISQSAKLSRHTPEALSQKHISDITPNLLQSEQSYLSHPDEPWVGEAGLQIHPLLHGDNATAEEISADGEIIGTDLVGPVPTTAELHKHTSYSELRSQHLSKLRKAGALGIIEQAAERQNLRSRRASTGGHPRKPSLFPTPPADDYIEFKMADDRRLAKEREYKAKTEAILQRRRDKEILKQWRDDTQQIQRKKNYEKILNNNAGKDYTKAVMKAPFAVEKEHMNVLTNEERIKQDVKNTHERLRRRSVSPASLLQIEEEKNLRIKELERRIKNHTKEMFERRSRPRGSTQEEMEKARHDLELAKNLQQELRMRKRDMEYRFKAFTGDLTSPPGKKTSPITS